ncbi:hypothetical protein P4910_24520 [Pantoea stewartii]|uniref:hypothetical protein n=1 Tax=Pantoea stewartii TaxID=66269 RepID=UPI0023F6502D|nr:hypothetical protein [Pantoea stewartii]MDF7788614.1 hypothetical protein [Pantoea stewartii]
MEMKTHLLTTLFVTSCFSQMAVADHVTTGSIVNKTTTTATVTLRQKITLENTLTPLEGLQGGTSIPSQASGVIAKGNLKIKEAGVTAQLALNTYKSTLNNFVTYATGHENDPDYKLEYFVYNPSDDTDWIETSDGIYRFTPSNVSNFDYTVHAAGSKLPKAGNYIISVTGATYNP